MSRIKNLDDPLAAGMEQLDVAIGLFLRKRSDICVVNLATAAEHLFECELKANGKPSALEKEFEFVDETERVFPIARIYSPTAQIEERRGDFFEFKRRERNFANHGPARNNGATTRRAAQRAQRPELRDVGMDAIIQASDNAKRLGLPISAAVRRFDKWYYEEVEPYY